MVVWIRKCVCVQSCAVDPRRLDQSRVGPGETAPQVLEYDPDASHFAYALVPRAVSVRWDLSSTWLPEASDGDYAALWDETANRGESQRAIAAQERQLLDTRFPTSVVCTYNDELGNRGRIYAISSLASSAGESRLAVEPSEPLARPYDSVVTTMSAYLAVASIWVVGALDSWGSRTRIAPEGTLVCFEPADRLSGCSI